MTQYSLENIFENGHIFFVKIVLRSKYPVLRKDKKMAGLEGFEPSTPAFGVRCSTNSSYRPVRWGYFTLFTLFMQGVFFTKFTEFAFFELFCCFSFVYSCRVVTTFALCALKTDDVCHFLHSRQL